MSSSRGRDGRHLLWLRVCDEFEVAHRVVTDRELEEPVEQHPAGAGLAPVEPEGELVEVFLQMLGSGGALMRGGQPPLDEGGDPEPRAAA